jgi:putative tryptophan/tyrosine transport system substrate-binding protein
MRRRNFIAGLASTTAAWPLAARAQPSAMPVIGFLGTASADDYAHFMPGFHRGLSETGYIEGQNVALEARFAENHVLRTLEPEKRDSGKTKRTRIPPTSSLQR